MHYLALLDQGPSRASKHKVNADPKGGFRDSATKAKNRTKKKRKHKRRMT